MLQAVAEGQGVALARRSLLGNDVRNGVLVQALRRCGAGAPPVLARLSAADGEFGEARAVPPMAARGDCGRAARCAFGVAAEGTSQGPRSQVRRPIPTGLRSDRQQPAPRRFRRPAPSSLRSPHVVAVGVAQQHDVHVAEAGIVRAMRGEQAKAARIGNASRCSFIRSTPSGQPARGRTRYVGTLFPVHRISKGTDVSPLTRERHPQLRKWAGHRPIFDAGPACCHRADWARDGVRNATACPANAGRPRAGTAGRGSLAPMSGTPYAVQVASTLLDRRVPTCPIEPHRACRSAESDRRGRDVFCGRRRQDLGSCI